MALADDALAFHGECIAEEGLRKALAPDAVFQQARDVERRISMRQSAVGFHRARACRRRQRFFQRLLEGDGEALELVLGDRQSRGLRMSAEAHDQAGQALGDEVEAIAQMVSRHRLVQGQGLQVVERAGLRLVDVDPVDSGPRAALRRADVAPARVFRRDVGGYRLDGVRQSRKSLEE